MLPGVSVWNRTWPAKCCYDRGRSDLASFGIGAKLRQERIGRGLTIEDIACETRIKPKFLEAIEQNDFDRLPGLVFARNFVRQYALNLHLDPDPLVAQMPVQDEAAIRLPDPPASSRFSYQTDRRVHSGVWLMLAFGAAVGAWFHFNHGGSATAPTPAVERAPVAASVTLVPQLQVAHQVQGAQQIGSPDPASIPVQVVITAHQAAWVQVSADGKNAFTGTLQPDESKEISATEQVKLVAGNAGGLTVSLNGKTLDPIGTNGQVKVLRLTAGGPEFLVKAPTPEPDPL